MITFVLIVGFLLALCYVIFKERTFTHRRITSLIIVGVGTLVLYTVASGIIAKKYPLKRITSDVKVLNGMVTQLSDTVYITAAIGYLDHKVYINKDVAYSLGDINIKFLNHGDTIPKHITTQEERQVGSNLWVVGWGLPYMNREKTVYVPNDSINIEMVKIIFEDALYQK